MVTAVHRDGGHPLHLRQRYIEVVKEHCGAYGQGVEYASWCTAHLPAGKVLAADAVKIQKDKNGRQHYERTRLDFA